MKLKYALIAFAVLAFYILVDTTTALAVEEDIQRAPVYTHPVLETYQMKATAYCLSGSTATGTPVREGIAASKREWFGKTVSLYTNDNGNPGQFIGRYVIEDTGGDNIRNGRVIDVWLPTYEQCKQFGRKNVIVVLED